MNAKHLVIAAALACVACAPEQVTQERVTTTSAGGTGAADDPNDDSSDNPGSGNATNASPTTDDGTGGGDDGSSGGQGDSDPRGSDTDGDDSASTGADAVPTLECADAVLTGSLPIAYTGSLDESSADDFYAGSNCTMGSEGVDLAFEFTAPAGGTYVFDTLTSSVDTVLQVYDRCDGVMLECNDDQDLDGGVYQSEISMDMFVGQTVLIVVDGYDDFEVGDFELRVQAM